jgi:hypothetical protein
MGEFWTGAYSDYQKVRNQFRHLAMLGFFGPPIAELGVDVKELRFNDQRVENVWKHLEEQVERHLIEHADEVEALVEALLEKQDLNNKEVLEILGKNSLQLAEEQGEEMESVLQELGVNTRGLAYQRRLAEEAETMVEPKEDTPDPSDSTE